MRRPNGEFAVIAGERANIADIAQTEKIIAASLSHGQEVIYRRFIPKVMNDVKGLV